MRVEIEVKDVQQAASLSFCREASLVQGATWALAFQGLLANEHSPARSRACWALLACTALTPLHAQGPPPRDDPSDIHRHTWSPQSLWRFPGVGQLFANVSAEGGSADRSQQWGWTGKSPGLNSVLPPVKENGQGHTAGSQGHTTPSGKQSSHSSTLTLLLALSRAESPCPTALALTTRSPGTPLSGFLEGFYWPHFIVKSTWAVTGLGICICSRAEGQLISFVINAHRSPPS